MNYNELLNEKAQNGFENFVNFIREDKNLTYEVEENDDNETEIEVSIFDEDMCTEFIGRYVFDENGTFLREE